MTTVTAPGGTITIGSAGTMSTAGTSITIPSSLLIAGKKYLFMITALSDGKANMETAPNRHALPIANADVVSAPITISGAS